MATTDPRQQIWPIFAEETREHLQQAGECLLALERPVDERPAGQLKLLLRALHSLKGGAGSLGFGNLERLAHAVEGSLARQPPEPVLSRDVVDLVLRAMRLLEGMVRQVEAGVGDSSPDGLDATLVALGADAAPLGSSLTPAPVAAADQLSLELWPVFRADVADALTLLAEALRGKKKPDANELTRLRELADSVHQSGATLGLRALEVAGAELRACLDAPWNAQSRAALQQWVATLEKVVAETDERLESLAPAPPPPAPAPVPSAPRAQGTLDGFFEESNVLLARIEESMMSLLTPDAEQRGQAQQEIRRLAHRLKGTTGAVLPGPPAELAAELQLVARELGAGGVEGAMASANFARLLVSYRGALEQARVPLPAVTAPAPVSVARPAKEPRAAEAPDSVIRVSRNAVESLTDVLERSAMSRARREAQLRSLLELRTLTQDALLWAERAGSELRMLDVQTPFLTGARERLRELSAGMKQVSAALWRDLESERIQGAQLKDTLRELRTVPAHTLGELLRRTARETAGRVGKNVQLHLAGGDVRLDRRIVDAVRDPLLHLLRNAVDHGLEAPQTRLQRGKPAEGRITLSVEQRGGRVVFALADDGGGLDLRRIRARATSRGLHDERALDAMSEADLARLIFLPGFSTVDTVTELSGRGVGLDVVEALARSLGGTVSVEHQEGLGTTFRLDLPRALGAVLGLVAKVGTQRLVLPNDAVTRLLRLTHQHLSVVGGRPMARVGDELLPFVPLARLLGLPGARLPLEGDRPVETVVLTAGAESIALGVDELLDHQELVVHGLGRHLKDSRHFAGAAQLSDGSVVPVLQASELIAMAAQRAPGGTAETPRTSILVADDALSTRMAIRNLLEIAGFDVLVAGNGEEAWELLQQHPVSLLITDLQMPRLDGLGLTRRVRSDARLAHLPVVVVTGQDAADDRAVGLEAGADAYLVKRDIERGALLDRVRQLLVVDP